MPCTCRSFRLLQASSSRPCNRTLFTPHSAALTATGLSRVMVSWQRDATRPSLQRLSYVVHDDNAIASALSSVTLRQATRRADDASTSPIADIQSARRISLRSGGLCGFTLLLG